MTVTIIREAVRSATKRPLDWLASASIKGFGRVEGRSLTVKITTTTTANTRTAPTSPANRVKGIAEVIGKKWTVPVNITLLMSLFKFKA